MRLAVPVGEFDELLRGERDLTADMAMRLAHFFGTSAEFWLRLQNLYDLRVTEQDHGDAIKALPTIKELWLPEKPGQLITWDRRRFQFFWLRLKLFFRSSRMRWKSLLSAIPRQAGFLLNQG